MTAAVETFVCECDTPERRPYIVTGHDGDAVPCLYCDDCAYLARADWNGETAHLDTLPEGWTLPSSTDPAWTIAVAPSGYLLGAVDDDTNARGTFALFAPDTFVADRLRFASVADALASA